QIIPFTGIERKTALYGVLDPVKITAINDAGGTSLLHYKKYKPSVPKHNYRYPIRIDETLRYVDEHLAANGAFRSASEICEIPLVPDPGKVPPVDPYPWTDGTPWPGSTSRAAID